MTTAEKKLVAIHWATEVRKARAELKRAVRAGEVKPVEVLMSELPDWLARMPVHLLLRQTPGWRRDPFDRMMREAFVSAETRLNGLGSRQRYLLVDRLSEWEALEPHRASRRKGRCDHRERTRARAAA